MSARVSYIGTIKGDVDVEEFRDVISSYTRNKGHLINITPVDDNSFELEARPDRHNAYYAFKSQISLIKKSDEKTTLEARGKVYLTGKGYLWAAVHCILSLVTIFWLIVFIIVMHKAQKSVEPFFNDIVLDAKNAL